jgi:uncharacterized protein involved in exopolysaccharide biosynthesis
MRKVIAQALVILRGASRYRWPAVAVAWLIAIAGWIGVQFIPDKFESRTQLYVDTESLLKPLLTSLAANPDEPGGDDAGGPAEPAESREGSPED